jgi:hypothetical protein
MRHNSKHFTESESGLESRDQIGSENTYNDGGVEFDDDPDYDTNIGPCISSVSC